MASFRCAALAAFKGITRNAGGVQEAIAKGTVQQQQPIEHGLMRMGFQQQTRAMGGCATQDFGLDVLLTFVMLVLLAPLLTKLCMQ